MRGWTPTKLRRWVERSGALRPTETALELHVAELITHSANGEPQPIPRGRFAWFLARRRTVVVGYSHSVFFMLVPNHLALATDLGFVFLTRVVDSSVLELAMYTKAPSSGDESPAQLRTQAIRLKWIGKGLDKFVARLESQREVRRSEWPDELRGKLNDMESQIDYSLPLD